MASLTSSRMRGRRRPGSCATPCSLPRHCATRCAPRPSCPRPPSARSSVRRPPPAVSQVPLKKICQPPGTTVLSRLRSRTHPHTIPPPLQSQTPPGAPAAPRASKRCGTPRSIRSKVRRSTMSGRDSTAGDSRNERPTARRIAARCAPSRVRSAARRGASSRRRATGRVGASARS
eukprot:6687009-Prymnesium_polylepis.1